MISHLVSWLIETFSNMGYTGIFVLMAIESSLFPLPSELVMIPAGYLVATGKMSGLLAVIAGGAGSVAGALCNYVLGRYIGKPFIEKYGKYFFIKKEKYNEAEVLFVKNAKISTFVGRLIPVIRHLISIPAGIFRMPLGWFVSITFVGASLWCSVLVGLGYMFGEAIEKSVMDIGHIVGYGALLLLAIFTIHLLFSHKKRR